jgi:hypothetical protein
LCNAQKARHHGAGKSDLMDMTNTTIKPLRLLLAGSAAALACAVPAGAADHVFGAVAPTDEPVSYAISVLDAGGATVSTLACDWVGYPGDDDVSSVSRVLAPAHALDATTRISPRADGTWLIRTTGASENGPLHNGRVCDREGRQCVAWDADGQARASKFIKRAARKLGAKR